MTMTATDLAEARPVRRGGWFETRSAARYVLARQWPPRFDVTGQAAFPVLRRGRLARQIRQDLWRALQDLRGFSPVVMVAATESGLYVTAGGRIAEGLRAPATTGDRITALLEDPAVRRRWARWARIGGRT